MNENVIEWLRGSDIAGITAPAGSRLKGRVVKLAQSHPDQVEIVKENPDGSIFAHVPVKFIKVSPPRRVSEEQRAAAAERLRKAREQQEDPDDEWEDVDEYEGDSEDVEGWE